MIIIDDIDQLSPEWYRLHAGVPGASSFSKIITPKGDTSKSQEDYILELIGERMTGTREDGYMSWDMQKGIEREDEARRTYEFVTGNMAKQVGFVFKDEERNVGCSPDALIIGETVDDIYPDVTYKEECQTGLEIKCPKMKSHVRTMVDRKVPDDKYIQIQSCMWVCGFHSWEFMSYYPGLEPVIITVKRDYKFTSALEVEMMAFLDELDEVYNKLKKRT